MLRALWTKGAPSVCAARGVLREARAGLRARGAPALPSTVPARRGAYLEAWLSSFENARAGIVRLNPEVWGVPLRPDIVHSTLVWARACQRAGTHKAKTKGEVSGTGKKPFPQKGRGRARHGSRRSPQFVGGGVAHPPRPRDYSYTLPKKVKALALKVALSDKYASGQLVVLSGYGHAASAPPRHADADSDAPSDATSGQELAAIGQEHSGKTRELYRQLSEGGLRLRVGAQKALLLHGGDAEGELVERAASNMPGIQARAASMVHLQDLISHTLLVASLLAVEQLERRLSTERRHALAVPPPAAVVGYAPDDPASAALAHVCNDGLSRAIVRPLPAGLQRFALAPDGDAVLPWAAVDVRAQRILPPAQPPG